MDKILQDLFGKIAKGEGSVAESDQLRQLLSNLSEADFKDAIEEYERMVRAQPTEPASEALINRFSEKVAHHDKHQNPGTNTPVMLKRLAVAALVLVVISIGFLLYHTKNARVMPGSPELQVKHIAPGKNGAVLTLSNGQKIMLSNASAGTSFNQGETRLVKTADSLLVYHSGVHKPLTQNFNTLQTPKGYQYSVVLSDGTRVWLNAASTLRYPTSFNGGDSRVVELTGEAYFEVVHNAKMPFRVKTNHLLVEDIGTKFNINSYTDEVAVKTTLLSGAVRVKALTERTVSVELTEPGRQAILQGGDLKMKQVNTDEVIAWKQGFFRLHSVDLKTFMRQVSRWYDIEVVYDGDIGEETYDAIIDRKASFGHILDILKMGGIHYRLERKKLILTP